MLGRFVDRGLPPLGQRQASTSEASVSNDHDGAILIEQQVHPTVKDLSLREPTAASAIWTTFDTGLLAQWSTEADVQSRVVQVMADAICLAGLPSGTIRLATELGLTRLRPDIWVLKSASGVPVGVIEVKRPSPAIMDHRRVHGQIFDYMRCVKTLFGVKHVLGIVTTYTKWRFYWFEESDRYAAADTCTAIENLGGARKEDGIGRVRYDDEGDEGEDDDEEEEEEVDLNTTFTQSDDDNAPVKEDESPRVLHGTKVYDSEQAGPELSALLASVVYKMWKSPCTPIPALSSSVRVCMNETQWFWARVPATIEDVNDADMPTGRATRFFLLRDLGGGVDGRAWRACTTSGTGCVIKFCKKAPAEDQRQRLEAEANVWRAAWGVEGVRVTTLAGEPALIMPYARAVKGQPLSHKAKQQVRAAIAEMASSGYCHEDLSWRHVGRLGLRRQRRVIFFDLASVSRVDTHVLESVTAAKAKMLNALGLE
ncbi:uncharacterized protein ACA1_378070 [Acanthamoeba castellanii str. Neff]|uniref:DUF5898 domain-containing protein n=1 Tax=Acanthamoeba castellanii (strain ATCC 30010 / Neff) TaxID=1257118 RepID=L8GRB5_ACACF|nr:uncharacterized protein ACA1_378070 [Acanthamoeba castellanii str. Neff]ELR15689.1 hypothetical protein ACA1_378070 [Acanthamoeba castellanii str. Neff]